MFCNEEIKEVLQIVNDYWNNSDYFFDYYNDMTCYLTKGYGFIFKTESKFVRLAYDGVKAFSNMDDALNGDEFAEPCVYKTAYALMVDYESTLFVGEKIVGVREIEGGFEVELDDFTLKLVLCKTADEVPMHYVEGANSYSRVMGCERLLKQKCECGGTGEIFEDFVADYVVRCNKCYKSTWASMCVADAIEDWNNGELHCNLDDITIE